MVGIGSSWEEKKRIGFEVIRITFKNVRVNIDLIIIVHVDKKIKSIVTLNATSLNIDNIGDKSNILHSYILQK